MSNDKVAATQHDGTEQPEPEQHPAPPQPEVQHGNQGDKQPEVQHSGPIGVVPVYAGGDEVPASAAAEPAEGTEGEEPAEGAQQAPDTDEG